jgi:hypothetical protein
MVLSDGKAGQVRPQEVICFIFSMLDAGRSIDSVSSVQHSASSIQHPVSSIQYPVSSILPAIKIRKTGSFVEHQGQVFSPMEITDQ